MSIQHDPANQAFITTRDGHAAELAYADPRPQGKRIKKGRLALSFLLG